MEDCFRREQHERDKKRLHTSICRIWKRLSRDQDEREPMKGNGVLVCDQSFIKEKFKIWNAEYFILTSSKALGEDFEQSDYEVEFCHVNDISKSKKSVSVKNIINSSPCLGSLVFVVLDTNKVKQFLFEKSVADRAFAKMDRTGKTGDTVECRWVKSSSGGAFTVEQCQLKCTSKSECDDTVIDIPANVSDLPLGSLILNDQKEVLGVVGKDSNGKYIVNTIAAAVNEAQGIFGSKPTQNCRGVDLRTCASPIRTETSYISVLFHSRFLFRFVSFRFVSFRFVSFRLP